MAALLRDDWTFLECVGFTDLLRSLALAMKERRKGFFGNIQRATEIVSKAYQGWKGRTIADFSEEEITKLMLEDTT